jgi:type IV secretory pathway protease TraF
MTPTYTDGDLLLVRRLGTRTLVSNDVVVFRAAAAVGAIRGRDLELLVKRVAATTGEPVPADLRPHVDDDRVVPPARILVLGDNSPSLDSREFGYLPYNSVIGTVVHVIAPASQH